MNYKLIALVVGCFGLSYGTAVVLKDLRKGEQLEQEAADSRNNGNYEGYPRLVGYDCEGAERPMFADEEDELPTPCRAIEEFVPYPQGD
jgi:hypothetical protein